MAEIEWKTMPFTNPRGDIPGISWIIVLLRHGWREKGTNGAGPWRPKWEG